MTAAMGNRIILCGRIHLSPQAFARAQEMSVLELFVVEPDDPVSAHPRAIRAKDLFSTQDKDHSKWARNTYDPKSRSWLFSCSLHDDDWFNADPTLLTRGLAALKDEQEMDVVFALVEWSRQLEAAWVIQPGTYSIVEALPALPEATAGLLVDGNIEDAERTIGMTVSNRWRTWS